MRKCTHNSSKNFCSREKKIGQWLAGDVCVTGSSLSRIQSLVEMGGAVLTELSELCKDLFLGDKFLLWLAPRLKSYLLPALDSRGNADLLGTIISAV